MTDSVCKPLEENKVPWSRDGGTLMVSKCDPIDYAVNHFGKEAVIQFIQDYWHMDMNAPIGELIEQHGLDGVVNYLQFRLDYQERERE